MSAKGRPLKVGVQLPEIERVAPWPDMKRMATTAEALGYDSIWLGDHLLYRNEGDTPKGPWEAWTMMAAIAAVTERVEIGPLVACTSFHNPAMIAKKTATLDEVSQGRIILGLGAGWNEPEYAAFGFPYDHRVSRFEEAFTIIRRLLDGETVTFNGEYYQTDEVLLHPPGPRKHVPLMVGSGSPRMLEITVPYIDSWNAWYAWFNNRPEELKPWLEKVDAACEKAGRDPSEIERTCAILVQMPDGSGRSVMHSEDAGTQPLSGEPEAMADALRKFADIGISHVQLVMDPITTESIEAFAPVLEFLDRG
jgi:probable F420-dependent oxidoreductase